VPHFEILGQREVILRQHPPAGTEGAQHQRPDVPLGQHPGVVERSVCNRATGAGNLPERKIQSKDSAGNPAAVHSWGTAIACRVVWIIDRNRVPR